VNGRCNGSRRYRPDSVAWVHHGNRGRPIPWALPAVLRRTILQLARGKYQGFNDSHLCEKLRSQERLEVSRESVRRILRRAKLASPQKRRARQYRARRLRRPRFGMMVLTDASRHVREALATIQQPVETRIEIVDEPYEAPSTKRQLTEHELREILSGGLGLVLDKKLDAAELAVKLSAEMKRSLDIRVR
jgi:transposase